MVVGDLVVPLGVETWAATTAALKCIVVLVDANSENGGSEPAASVGSVVVEAAAFSCCCCLDNSARFTTVAPVRVATAARETCGIGDSVVVAAE